jgi:hypothetical protein
VIFEQVMLYDIKQGEENGEYRKDVQYKGVTPYQVPYAAVRWIACFGTCSTPVTEHTEQRHDKSQYHKKMTEFPRSEMFTYELSIQ